MGHQEEMVQQHKGPIGGRGGRQVSRLSQTSTARGAQKALSQRGQPWSRGEEAFPEVSLSRLLPGRPHPTLCCAPQSLPCSELPVEEAGLLPEHHHHIAARVQVAARDGHLGAPGHGPPAGLQV